MKWLVFNKRRFTLVEMLAALVIMIIIASLAVPAISKLMGSQGVDGAASMLQSKLRAVRAYAVANRKTAGLFIFADGTEARTSFRPVEWIPTVPASSGPPATAQVDGYWQFIADTKVDFLPTGGAMEGSVVFSNTYIDFKPATNPNLLKSGSLMDLDTGLSGVSQLAARTVGTSSGWIIAFKSNGQPVVPDAATALYPPSYAAVALRVAAAKLEAAGTLSPKNDNLMFDHILKKYVPGKDLFEDVDFSTLVTDRYSGQVYIIPNK